MSEDIYIERHILIGLIVSTEYINEIRDVWDHRIIKSPTARRMAGWCLEYYDKYNQAPGEDIESIYFEKLDAGEIPEDEAEELEQDILPDLSDEYERQDKFNLQYLLDRTDNYFTERNLDLHQEQVSALREDGQIKEAEDLAINYTPIQKELDNNIDLSNPDSLHAVEKAFTTQTAPILEYPGALGEFMNPQLVRDSFIAFLAPEKRGKSFWLLDMAYRAVRQRLNVAFFQAGDMSEAQQLRRLGIHLAKRSDREEYCGEIWEPVKDCKHNQIGDCNKEVRESIFGLEGTHAPDYPEEARRELTFDQLVELYNENQDYKACYNCNEYTEKQSYLGAPWIKKINTGPPLQKSEARKLFEKYFIEKNRNLRISTHANNTLSIPKIKIILDKWYREGFIPDLIVIDYADLMTASAQDERAKQNEIWKGFRNLSQERHCILATATQADANSYEQGLLKLKNFSEDKRKYAHVTAMYGLNQDPGGREKDIGIMRINKLVIREGESKGIVHVLQNLKRGQPILTSYW